MNVEIPPAQDSPKHILNALNDDCIQLILRRLKNVWDYVSAAETCVRFQENAKLIFRTQFKEIRIDKFSRSSNTVTVNRVANFLNIFGHLVTRIYFDRLMMNVKLGDNIQNMIANHCGKTLKTFTLRSNHNVVDLNTPSLFEVLEELKLHDTNIRNFEHQTQLNFLYISGFEGNISSFDWLIQTFPKLKKATFWTLHQLLPHELIGFLKLNPQLKCFKIDSCNEITSQYFEDISNVLPNVEKLFFYSKRYVGDSSYHFFPIENLKKLKSLIICALEFPVKQLVDSLVENEVQIENLAIECKAVLFESKISQLKSLKKLYLSVKIDETLVQLVRNLPQLQEIVIGESFIKLNEIEEALKCGKHLSMLMIETNETSINLNDFNSILNSAKLAGVKVVISIKYNGKIDVPEDILHENRKWLDVNKKRFPYVSRMAERYF